jgi:hypothetical protein
VKDAFTNTNTFAANLGGYSDQLQCFFFVLWLRELIPVRLPYRPSRGTKPGRGLNQSRILQTDHNMREWKKILTHPIVEEEEEEEVLMRWSWVNNWIFPSPGPEFIPRTGAPLSSTFYCFPLPFPPFFIVVSFHHAIENNALPPPCIVSTSFLPLNYV